MRLLVIRHGQTIENVTGIMQGHAPGRLSELGKKQVKSLTNRLKNEKIDFIYSSDLRRCKQTINPLLKIEKIPIIYTKELRERDYGLFNGKPREKAIEWFNKQRSKDKFSVKPPNGESFYDLKKRVSKFIAKLIKKHKGKNVLIVTHGGTKVAIMLHLFKKEVKYFNKYAADNTALSIINIKDDGNHKARLLNSTKHLS